MKEKLSMRENLFKKGGLIFKVIMKREQPIKEGLDTKEDLDSKKDLSLKGD